MSSGLPSCGNNDQQQQQQQRGWHAKPEQALHVTWNAYEGLPPEPNAIASNSNFAEAISQLFNNLAAMSDLLDKCLNAEKADGMSADDRKSTGAKLFEHFQHLEKWIYAAFPIASSPHKVAPRLMRLLVDLKHTVADTATGDDAKRDKLLQQQARLEQGIYDAFSKPNGSKDAHYEGDSALVKQLNVMKQIVCCRTMQRDTKRKHLIEKQALINKLIDDAYEKPEIQRLRRDGYVPRGIASTLPELPRRRGPRSDITRVKPPVNLKQRDKYADHYVPTSHSMIQQGINNDCQGGRRAGRGGYATGRLSGHP